MNRNTPLFSVIIPTHNRCEFLLSSLESLSSQTFPSNLFEVIVVADGCTDNTLVYVSSLNSIYPLRIIEQSDNSAASARNNGARNASGTMLLFIDDDIIAEPNLIEAHYKAHEKKPGHVIIGPYPACPCKNPSFFQQELRNWWYNKFKNMEAPGHRFTFLDLVSGNFSIEAKVFFKAGGFEASIRSAGGEDHELGIRLINARVPFYFCNEARAMHCMNVTYDNFKTRKQQEGYVDVIISRRYPKLITALPLFKRNWQSSLFSKASRFLALHFPRIGDKLVSVLKFHLNIFESLRLRNQWQSTRNELGNYWYWRGVGNELQSNNELKTIFQNNQIDSDCSCKTMDLDLKHGLDIVKKILDDKRPNSVRIRYGEHPVGIIREEPGAEALRGSHLRPILGGELATQLLIALASTGAIVSSSEVELLKLTNSIRKKSVFGGKQTLEKIWSDRFSQWMNQQGNELGSTVEFWDIQNKIRDLEHKKAWVKQEWSIVKHKAEEMENTIKEQQILIQKYQS